MQIAVISESLFPALYLVGWGRTREVKGENSGLEARAVYWVRQCNLEFFCYFPVQESRARHA